MASGGVVPPVAERGFDGRGGPGRPRRALWALALSLLLAGCYSYTEVSPAAVPPGSSVRLRVDPGVRLSVGAVPLPEARREMRGTLLPGSSPDTLLFSVVLRNSDPLSPSRPMRGTVPIGMADVERLELRRLDKVRTGGAVGLGAILGLAVLDWAFNVVNSSEVPGEGPGGDNARRVFLRLRW